MRPNTRTRILELLLDGRVMTPMEVTRALGIAHVTARMKLCDLVALGAVERVGYGKYRATKHAASVDLSTGKYNDKGLALQSVW